ncbi:tetratricopeptide repeat protein [Nostoc sp. XA010]|uniref:tetratricopeptide repeat protein n=1 Tax=Nostoc sp. XA010 TaxID=2780407 RepID=UPI001E3D14A0|nr:tetratricopeptide repeat protein [Nostoc sp. XA010]MCC5659049.1 tetratricopeptide repeat protein [Nostoc sp. XA010]
MKFINPIMMFSLLGGVSITSLIAAETAYAQINIQQMAATSCAVMSGERKLDRQSLQYLSILDYDFADANPVAIALFREVSKQCPKTYLNFQQRKRVSNPFPPGYLVKPNPTPLLNSNPQPDMAKYDEAIRQHPDNAEVYFDRGNARLAQKDFQGAIADYTEVLRLEPNNPKVYANRGLARKNLGDKKGAIADLEVAMKLFKAKGDQSSYQKILPWLREAKKLP